MSLDEERKQEALRRNPFAMLDDLPPEEPSAFIRSSSCPPALLQSARCSWLSSIRMSPRRSGWSLIFHRRVPRIERARTAAAGKNLRLSHEERENKRTKDLGQLPLRYRFLVREAPFAQLSHLESNSLAFQRAADGFEGKQRLQGSVVGAGCAGLTITKPWPGFSSGYGTIYRHHMETVKYLRLEQRSGTDATSISPVPIRESAAEFRKLRFASQGRPSSPLALRRFRSRARGNEARPNRCRGSLRWAR